MTKFPFPLHVTVDISPASLHGSSRWAHSSQDVSRGPQWVFRLQNRTLEQPDPRLEDLQPNILNQHKTAGLDAVVPTALAPYSALTTTSRDKTTSAAKEMRLTRTAATDRTELVLIIKEQCCDVKLQQGKKKGTF